MPKHPDNSSTSQTGDFDKFKNFMQRLMSVPHSEIKAKLDAEKQAKKRKRRSKASASRVANDREG